MKKIMVIKESSRKIKKYFGLASWLLLGVVFVLVSVARADTPSIVSFILPETSESLTVPIIAFTASNVSGIAGFYLSEGSFPPAFDDPAWMPEAPGAFVFVSGGSKIIYAWVKDAAGDISAISSDSVVVNFVSSDNVAPAAPSSLSVL
jgi:hypothetical protein